MRFFLPLVVLQSVLTPAMDAREPERGAGLEAVADSGPLGEHELILLAISNRPELEKLRGIIATAIAQRQAAGDLVNPELRLSYARDYDDRILRPYTERERSWTGTRSSSDTFSSSGSLVQSGGGSVSETEFRRERSSSSGSRFREIERRVTPGATTDVIEERVYESSSSRSRSSTSSSRSDDGGTTRDSGVEGETVNRRLVSATRTEIDHPDSRRQDDAWAALVRFTLPHPWERRARIQRAAAEVTLAESEYYAAEDQVVRTVRGALLELAILRAKLAAQQSRKGAFEAYRDWIDGQKAPRLGHDLAAARAKVFGLLPNLRELQSDIAATHEELAAYCGLLDAGRIAPALVSRRIADPAALDSGYLTDIAMAYRSDVLSTQARLAAARAQLAEARSARIPFSTFVDLGYTQETTRRRSGQGEEWFVRMGVSIPLWEWTGFNKKHRIPEQASESLEREIALQRGFIATEISRAVRRLAAADQQLAGAEKDLDDLQADMKKALEETRSAATEVSDLIKSKRIEYEFQDIEIELEVSRLSALAAYHEALMGIEKALGVRLERVLDSYHLSR